MKNEKMGPKVLLLGLGSMLGTLLVLAAVCGPIMGLLGFQYESLGSFLLFFVLASLASWPLGLAAVWVPRALKLTGWDSVLIYLPLDTLASLVGFIAADYLLDTVAGNGLSLGLASLAFALPGVPELRKTTEQT